MIGDHGKFLFGRAEDTLRSANKLQQQNRDWPNVYYLSGLVVEHALWAIRCERAGLLEPDFQALPNHDLRRLAEHAGLSVDIQARCKASRDFRLNWLTVTDWDSNRRFKQVSKQDARVLLLAVANPTQGLMPWLRNVYQTLP